jgi:hypothetical protein
MKLTQSSEALFLAYANDACNWSGTPPIGVNVGGTKEDRGNLTHLKREGLIETWADGGQYWIYFTDKGRRLAKAFGIKIE